MARVEMPNSRARSAMEKRSRLSCSGRFTALLFHGRVFLAQFLLAQLADQRLGQLVPEDDLPGHFQLVEPVGEELLQLALGDGAALAQLDEGDRRLAAI